VAALLWTLNGRLSVLYNTKVVTYNAIYGSLGVVPLFLLGMYLSWLILLFGAQAAYVFQYRHAYLQERRAGKVHQEGREFLALRMMALIAGRFLGGEPPIGAARLSEVLCAPPKLVKDILLLLHGGGLLVEAAGPEQGYTPAKPADKTTIREILTVMRTGSGYDIATADDGQLRAVLSAFRSVLDAGNRRAETIMLQSLAQTASR
jgi:membrane protein